MPEISEEKLNPLDEIDSLFEQETLYRQSRLVAHITLLNQSSFILKNKKKKYQILKTPSSGRIIESEGQEKS